MAKLIKNGAGSSNQNLILGDSLVPFSYVWENAETVTATGFPMGVNVFIDSLDSRISISGTPTEFGEFVYTITTVGADSNASVVRTIRVAESETAITHQQTVLPKASSYRVFDLQGRLLYRGAFQPRIYNQRVLVVEFDKEGNALRKYLMPCSKESMPK